MMKVANNIDYESVTQMGWGSFVELLWEKKEGAR
jgi:hypothetical protein